MSLLLETINWELGVNHNSHAASFLDRNTHRVCSCFLLLQEYPSQLATLAQRKHSANQGEGTKAHQRAVLNEGEVSRERLTSLVGCDADSSKLPGEGAEVRHAVDGVDLEGVVGVCQQVHHGDRGVGEPALPRQEPHVVAAGLALPAAPSALLADNVEGDVLPAPRVQGPAPVQDHRGLVDVGDHVSRGGWRSCEREIRE